MNREYDITDDEKKDWIFYDEGTSGQHSGYISYRNVICRALVRNIRDDTTSESLKSDLFIPLKDAFDKEESKELENFFKIYFSKDLDDQNLIFLIDGTKGCYPLGFYKDTNRIVALQKALNDIDANWDDLFKIISKSPVWNKDLQDSLNKIYKHKDN